MKKPLLLHLEAEGYTQKARQLLEDRFTVDYHTIDDQHSFLQQLAQQDYQIIFTKLGLMLDEEALSHLPSLRYIVTPTTGLNHIDLPAAAKRNIQVISLKGETEFLNTITSTSEHTWALILQLVRNLTPATEDVKRGHWQRKPFMAFDLRKRKMGIIGYGRLGKIVARYAAAFEMEVLANDTNPAAFKEAPEEVQVVELEQVLREADVISLHIPYSKENEAFFNAEKFALLKPQAYFINTSRGEVIEESALLSALQQKQIRGAAVDVLEGDSAWADQVAKDNALWQYATQHDNLIISPHMGGYGDQSIFRTRDFITDKFLQYYNQQR